MKFFKVVGIAFIFCITTLQLNAQRSFLEDADHALYNEEKYFEAIEMYKKAYVKETGRDVKAEIIYKIAEAYRLSDQAENAEVWYDKSIIAKYADPLARLHLAEMKMQNGKYDEALIEYQKYAAIEPKDERGRNGIEAAKQAQDWNDKPENYIVEPAVLLNTEFYDYGLTFSDKNNNEIVFTSTREGSVGTDISDVTGDNFSDLYTSKRDKKGKWSEPVLLEGDGLNTEASEGAAVFNSRRNVMYFTHCMYDKRGYFGCKLKSAKKQGTKYGQIEDIPISNDSATIGHPAITPDDKVIIFASDMPGGQGGKDLWYIREEARNKWSEPINLGPQINTSGNEMFPFVRENGDLYFSSDGHVGMGGLDNYVAKKKGNAQWGNVENLKAPLNSNANDFAIVFDGKGDKGYFSSNREGGRGKDDIWEFSKPPILFILKGIVLDLETKEVLVGAEVHLIGTDGTNAKVETDANGEFEFAENGDKYYINKNTSYSITVSKANYLNAKGKETTVGLIESKIFAHKYELQPFSDQPIKLPEILYAFDDIRLTEQAKDSLDFLYNILVDNPNLVIELRANTDSRGSPSYNNRLSQGRAESVVKYLASRGIPIERMVPKGYGESNLLISDEEINKLATEEEREAAHQLNRRTEFSILRDDYVPQEGGESVNPDDIDLNNIALPNATEEDKEDAKKETLKVEEEEGGQ